MTIAISPTRLTRLLSAIVACLVLASVGGQVSKLVVGHDRLLGFVHLFDLDKEANVPTWYSSATLLIASALLAVIACAKRQQRAPFSIHWSALALIFLYISLDETAGVHELSVLPLRTALGLHGALYFAWVIPAAAVVTLVGLAYLRFVFHLPAQIRRLVVIAGGVYVGGALGMELVGGWLAERSGQETLAYVLAATVEEALEMAGIVVFIHALLRYIGAELGEVRVAVDLRS